MPYKDPIKAKAYLKDYVAKRRDHIREMVRSLKTECARCGYDRCYGALHFHHTNADEKELTLAHAVRYTWSDARILAEIEKCIVLCANCHAETHYGVQATIG